MNKENIGNLIGNFTWSFFNKFFIETDQGNFIWSDPDYPGGDGTIKQYNNSYKDWIKEEHIPFGRDKGIHRIKDYCGDFKYIKG